jgi:hypothetical protein
MYAACLAGDVVDLTSFFFFFLAENFAQALLPLSRRADSDGRLQSGSVLTIVKIFRQIYFCFHFTIWIFQVNFLDFF